VQAQHIHSDEISSGGGFKSGSRYDGFNVDMLLDMVVTLLNGYACGEIRSLSGLSVDDNKEYWSNMFSVCNSLPNGNHSGMMINTCMLIHDLNHRLIHDPKV